MGSPLKDVRVRQAINYGIDRAAALQVMGAGYGVPTTQVFAKYNKGYVASLDNAYPFSIDKAKSLLKDAGYPNGFKLEMPLNGALNPAVGQFIKDSLEKIGIIVNYTSYASGSDFFAAVQAPKYAMFRQGLERNPNSWTLLQFLLARDSAWNPSGYGDATSDKLISRIAHASGLAVDSQQLNWVGVVFVDFVRGVGERSGCTEASVETILVERPEVRMPD